MAQTQIPGTQIKDASITEADLTLSDVTTLNASISAHGLLPKLPNDAKKYINGQGNWAVPANPVISFTTGLTSLTIDLSGKEYCIISISANESFNLSNITTGKLYGFSVKNSGEDTITVSLTSGQIFAASSVDISSGAAREFSMLYDGSKQRWMYSEELVNA